ncbi:MAG: PAS domain-containing protein, partial [Gemmatimonadales bacterium]
VAQRTRNSVIITDAERRIEWVNDGFTRMTGYTLDEVRGRVPGRLLQCPQTDPATVQRIGQALAAETGIRCEILNRGKRGTHYWIDTEIQPLFGEHGLTGFIAIQSDITEQVLLRRSVVASAERLRLALDGAHLGTWDYDPRSGTLAWDARIREMFGLAEGPLKGTLDLWLSYVHPREVDRVREEIRVAAERGEFVSTYAIQRADGKIRHLESRGRVVRDGDGRLQRLIGVSQDVTERRQREHDAHQAQKLESIGQLAAGVAHEINTPVQFVSDSVHFVREAAADLLGLTRSLSGLVDGVAAGRSPDEAAAAARRLCDAADLDYLAEHLPGALDRALDGLQRVATIVRSIRAFAHPDDRDMKPADLNEAIEATLTMARNEYKYVADVDTDLGDLPLVTCHVGDLNQVVLNLLINAAHAIEERHGPEGRGKIRVRTRHEGDLVVIEVADTGAGIPDGVRHRIFDPFFTTKEVGKGTGQGLAIAHSVIVDRHGGQIGVESAVGVGTTFTLTIPVDGHLAAGTTR